MNDTEKTIARAGKTRIGALFATALLSLASGVSAVEAAPVDCPLRDEPYSIDAPLIDILLNPEAAAVVNRHLDGALDKMPERFISKTPPSFSAILSVKTVAGMARAEPAKLEVIDRELAQVPITDAARVARCARYDSEAPELAIPAGKPRLLLFGKITGFKDTPSFDAAEVAVKAMAERRGWSLIATENGAAMTPEILDQFDAVIWNNISGDVLTLSQRKAFVDYMQRGGGYVGIHGSAGDPNYFWDWYRDELIGASFIGHPMNPQFQQARVVVEKNEHGIGRGLPAEWTMNDEWYSFASSPRLSGAKVIATLDESTYSPVGREGQELKMGDHPIVWTRCVQKGRMFYSAIGHRPEVYAEPNHLKLLEQGILWAAEEKGACRQ